MPIYRFQFIDTIAIERIESVLLSAITSAESLHGSTQVRLDTAHYLDADGRRCVIDATTSVGRDINHLFVGHLDREFGPDAYSVERVSQHQANEDVT